jgi:hypothetical protein
MVVAGRLTRAAEPKNGAGSAAHVTAAKAAVAVAAAGMMLAVAVVRAADAAARKWRTGDRPAGRGAMIPLSIRVGNR